MYTRSFTFFVISLLAVLCISCQSKSTEIPVIDIDNPTGAVDLNISDLLNNITIVPLETNDDLLLSTAGGTSFTVTNRYILVSTREKLLQFDRKGKYIRTLAIRGNGPNEFSYIYTRLVDEKLNRLYYVDARGNNIPVTCIDLSTGKFLEFPNPDLPAQSIQAIDAEGNIYGYSSASRTISMMSNMLVSSGVSQKASDTPDSLLAYKYNPIDNIITHFHGYHSYLSDDRSRTMFQTGDHVSFLFFPYSDTLFHIDGNKMKPQYIFNLKNQMTNMQEGGATLRFPFSSAHGTIISLLDSKITIIQSGGTISGITVRNSTKASLFLDKTKKLRAIKSITIEPIALTVNMDGYLKNINEERGSENKINPIPSVSGAWGYYAVEALDMIEFMEQALKGNKLSASQRKALEEVAAKIDDDSNPVLMIGKIK